MKKSNKIAVLGAGVWGTVLAQHLARGIPSEGRLRRRIWLWEILKDVEQSLRLRRRHPHIPGLHLQESVHVTSSLPESVEDADVLVFVLPSAHIRQTAREANRDLRGRMPLIVSASKGVEPRTLLTVGDMIREEMPGCGRGIYTLSGPSFAKEVAMGAPTKLVLAGPAGPRARYLRSLFNHRPIVVETSTDRKGVELGGSLKNVLAIGCGILDGLAKGRAHPCGINTKAALFLQGIKEMGSLISKWGGRRQTAFWLAGMGDLIATGTSPQSRNRSLGEKLGAGKPLPQAQAEISEVVEGIDTALSVSDLCARAGGKYPLFNAIYRILHQGAPPQSVLEAFGFE
ncbi:MAG: NAD(P)-dependent glycerol-3-phosphate dehydrogenase [Elusimicrobia bacterium]|nr:NAD(P)-dependent glycerol-3-phosphate dehydrogenase [Elusimicrobiota bacterium]